MLQEDVAARAPAVPFVYGSIAFWLGKKANTGEHTHKWSVYVRHARDKDLSYAVERVEITLHPSFANPVRGQHPRSAGAGGLETRQRARWKALALTRRIATSLNHTPACSIYRAAVRRLGDGVGRV